MQPLGQSVELASSEPSQQSHTPSFTREEKICLGLCGRFRHT